MIRALLAVLILATPSLAQEPADGPAPPPTPAQLLDRAESAFESGAELRETDPAAADASLEESIAAYRALIERGVENAAIHRNIGNAFMLRGDPGRAIIAFRRAERIDPADERVRESLAAARGLVRSEVDPGLRAGVADAILFWRGHVPRPVLLATGLAAWALLWLALAVRLFTRRGAGLAGVAGVVCVLTLGSLLGERAIETMNPAGVVVRDGVTGFRGPSRSVYDPTFEQPIRAGVEASILEHRNGWTRLRLRSGAETWVPENAVEPI